MLIRNTIYKFKYKKIKTGFFKRSKFDIIPTENHPPQSAMMEHIVKKAPKKEVLLNRLNDHQKTL